MSIKLLCNPSMHAKNNRVTIVYTQMVSSIQPIASNLQLSYRWLVYKENTKNANIPHTTHTEDMYQIYQQKERDT